MHRIRILIVDDSATIRRLLVEALSVDPEIEVAGTAPNGALGLAMIRQHVPDVVVLDIDMPVMNGLEMLRELRPLYPRLPVIVFSSLTSHGAEITLQALWMGASDYVTKPSASNPQTAILHVRSELLPRIKAFARTRSGSEIAETGPARRQKPVAFDAPSAAAPPTPGERAQERRAARDAARKETSRPGASRDAARKETSQPAAAGARAGAPAPRPRVLAIASSTGGPRALADVLGRLPADFPLPVLVVQHMPPTFTRHLADGLASQCDLKVFEAHEDAPLEPGKVWIAPGDRHMTVTTEGMPRVRLVNAPPENECRPSADPLFRSVADAFEQRALVVVLTGMGRDGLEGCRRVRALGGRVIAQDEHSSVVWGMPGAVSRAGLADIVLPLEEIAAEIMARTLPGGQRHVA